MLMFYLYPLKYREEIIEISDFYGVDRALIFATVNVESRFDKNARSNKGAKGLMQITDDTATFIAKSIKAYSYDIYDVKTNLSFGCYYIKYLIDRFGGERLAMIAYNAGEGNVKNWLLNPKYSKDGKTLSQIPFKESREYIEKIEKSLIKYKKLYSKIVDK